jgi:hypothetical protein
MQDEVKPDTQRALRTLKTFQRDTVDHVFQRMYMDDQPVRRFLVADEVGLGKTLVARGIVARMVDHLWEKVGRLDIVYICSNNGIARQNITRLNITGRSDHQLPDRITLLPGEIRNLHHRLNFISFTPGTSFNLKSSLGVARERALLFWLIPDDWKVSEQGAYSVLRGSAGREGFKQRVTGFDQDGIDDNLRTAFRDSLARADGEALKKRFTALCGAVGRREALDGQESAERSNIVGTLRQTLARVCVEALQPDLVILDEFQRFKDLLRGEDFAAGLAKALFDYTNAAGSEQARVLLLSATPYKMYTAHDETAGDDHYRDFIDTVRFLQDDPAKTDTFQGQLQSYRRHAFRYDATQENGLQAAKAAIETTLKTVMVRTERLAVTPDRDGMLTEVPPSALTLQPEDLRHYLSLQRVARVVGHGDVIDFWKSAAYVLNFMEDYALKRQIRNTADSPRTGLLCDELSAFESSQLSPADLTAYKRIDPANARLRSLLNDTVGRGAAVAFWIPPSAPYYSLEEPFAALQGFTKRLVFSAWQVVPKVVASLVSFEAERRLMAIPDEGTPGSNTPDARRRRRGLLRYGFSAGRLTGMPVLALMYPSPTMAAVGDPLRAAAALRETAGGEVALDGVLSLVTTKLSRLLEDLDHPSAGDETVDQRWYWAAPILLDLAGHAESTKGWFDQRGLSTLWQGTPDRDGEVGEPEVDADDRWTQHVEEARKLLGKGLDEPLGKRPDDLADVLARLAVGGFANNALRALGRIGGGGHATTVMAFRNAAGNIAEGFRSLFNQPEVVASIQQSEQGDRYWSLALDYCVRGCLSAVLDEYAHVAFESDGLAGKAPAEVASTIARRMTSALTLQTATLRADMFTLNTTARTAALNDTFGFRTAFAVRYGTRGDEGDQADRNQRLQISFNSPFWPFVLCSTSVGQEGLDFHTYCHAVVHWNLPSNPVDLEQREGRVHRYKGHAVRRNVALRHRHAPFTSEDADPWLAMFREARESAHGDDSDLVPYWVYPVENGAKIERHVPALPLSRDAARYQELRRALTLYRMAFGQSRQQDLIDFLQRNVPPEARAGVAADLTINLAPPRSRWRDESTLDDTHVSARDLSEAIKAGHIDTARDAPSTIASDRLLALLDDFRECQLAERRSVPSVAARPPAEILGAFESLLDDYTGLRRSSRDRPETGRTQEKQRATHSRQRLCSAALADLLDQFAALRPESEPSGDRAKRFQDLLDAYCSRVS